MDTATGDSPRKNAITVEEKNLVVSFIQFLRHKVSSGQCSEVQLEGFEVAVQCLESAFDISDKNYAFQPSKPLLSIFAASEGAAPQGEDLPLPSKAEIAKANQLKEEGNDLVKAGKLQDGISKYNEAIKLNRDPIYFCNRAAVYCRLEQFELAIQDCRTALALDPKYSKAHGRMGLALSCQHHYDKAVEAYKKALELEPNNESYKLNLSIAESKLQDAQNAFSRNPLTNPFGFDINNLLNNPQIMNMATQMFSNPDVQSVMTQIMGALAGGQQQGAGSGAHAQQPEQTSGGNSFEHFLRAGESFAELMQRANPQLVEQLRRQYMAANGGQNNPEGQSSEDNNPSAQ